MFTIPQLIVWLIVGAVAGTLVGRLVTLKKKGLGRGTNLGVGMIGALIGGLLFQLFRIDLGAFGKISISVKDLVAALAGSLLFVVVWWLVAKFRGK